MDDIAIIGIAGLFPGAPDLSHLWELIFGGHDATSAPPPGSWDPALYFAPDSTANDRVYCARGGFLGDLARFDPLANGVMPNALAGSEPDQWLALQVARAAFRDAGYGDEIPRRHSTAVILGKGTYLNQGNLTAAQHGQVLDQTIAILQALHPEHTPQELERVRAALKASLPPFTPDTAPGLIPNITVGRIANRLDLMGPSYTVDAACASALVAVDLACRDLRSGRCDMALVGGVHVVTPVPVLMLFCQLGALSRRQQIRPFDAGADGTLLSEGLGMAVLKRREDAERDGDRIYALIKGVGVASDGKALSVLAPRVDGEEAALRRAYEQAGVTPGSLGLIEAHGTATLVGDATEIQALCRVFGERGAAPPHIAIGSIKSQIGHTMPAAGMAGLIKAALALHERVLPPTIHVETPSPQLGLEQTPFYVNTVARPWIHGGPEPRRAGVNAFGFGGINAHVVLEEAAGAPATSLRQRWGSELLLLAAPDRAGLASRGGALLNYLAHSPAASLKDLAYTLNIAQGTPADSGALRLAIVATSVDDLRAKLERALARVADPACERIKEKAGVFFFAEPLGPRGKLALLFPGEGAQYVGMLGDLALHFPSVRACFDAFDAAFAAERSYRLSQVVFPPPAFEPKERAAVASRILQMDVAIEALVAANHGVYCLLGELGLRPDGLLGHSTGELAALRVAGMLRLDDFASRVRALNRAHESHVRQDGVPAAQLLAIGASRDEVEALRAEIGADGLFVAMDNCPHQVVLAGTRESIERASALARQRKLFCEPLAWERAYHTPLYAPYAAALEAELSAWIVAPPQIPLYSCVTAAPYPADLAAVKALAHTHWTRPVEFRRTIEAMYADGFRIFVEAGPRGNLSAFLDDILRGRAAVVAPADQQRRPGLLQLQLLLGLLAAHHVPLDLTPLYARRNPRTLDIDTPAAARPDRSVLLSTGWPPMRYTGAPLTTNAEQAMKQDEQLAPDPSAFERSSHVATEIRPARNGHTPEPGVEQLLAFPEAPPAARGAPATAPAMAPAADGATAQVMLAYMQTMEQFLRVQQDVMRAYLSGGPPTSTATPSARSADLLSVISPRPPQLASAVLAAEAISPPQVAPPPAAPAPATPPPMLAPPTAAPIDQLLLGIVAEKTGYPSSMLGLDLDIEADLGIDSIKRIEILGALQQTAGLNLEARMEELAALRTLRQLIELLSGAPVAGQNLGKAEALRQDQALRAELTVSLEEFPGLRDHTLGRGVARSDPELDGLPLLPLTLSMELLAAAAAPLAAGHVLVGMRDVRARRWIALDAGPVRLALSAERRADGIYVSLDEAGADGPPIVEGLIRFAPAYPAPRQAPPFALPDAEPGRWPADQLYRAAMFHGPRFQGVRALEAVGPGGASAQLAALSPDGLFEPRRRTLTDPVLLDQPGQVVGFWAAQRLEHSQLVFPYALRELELFGPPPDPGTPFSCRATIALEGEQRVRSTLDIVDAHGALYARLSDWEDRRFDLPAPFRELILNPSASALSRPWELAGTTVRRLGLDDFPPDLLTGHGMIWLRALAFLVLGRRERRLWAELRTPARRRAEWLLARVAAKEATRDMLAGRYGLELNPADIEILPDEHGAPQAHGAWLAELGRPPLLSLAHSRGVAVALVVDNTGVGGVGIDIEPGDSLDEEAVALALDPQERALLAELPVGWQVRAWCAKEAAGKATGLGLRGNPRALRLEEIDQTTGSVRIAPGGSVAQTGVVDGLTYAVVLPAGPDQA